MLEDPTIAWHVAFWKDIGASGAAALAASKIFNDEDDFLGGTIMAFLFALLLAPLAKMVLVMIWINGSPETYEAVFGEAGMLNIVVGGFFVGFMAIFLERGVFACIGALLWRAIGPMVIAGGSALIGGTVSSGGFDSGGASRIDRFVK